MGIASVLRLSPEAKIRLPNVDEALNVGYAIHSADDPALRNKIAQQNAQIVVERFLSLEAETGSPEEAYLTCVRAIVHSQARGITRRKEQYSRDLKAAQLRRRRQRNSIRQSRRSNDLLNSAWRLLGPVILGLSGYLFAQLFAVFVPEEVATQTGSRIPAILMGLVFVAIGRSIGFYVNEMRRNKIESEYNSRCYLAFLTYEIGKLKEFRQYRGQLCEAWLQYAGEEYPITASYQMVMESDIETRRQLERHLQVYDTGSIRLIMRMIRILRGKRKSGLEKLPSLPSELAAEKE
ncbi:MAG TPA: hypothetical protein VNO18_04355 [Xanthobacteraceae bacterium]|jgi:hypothetical protein|nr:hypothetical protein [Xanthobacteraceae bacterium]